MQITSQSTSDRDMVAAPLNAVWVTPRVTGGTELTFDLAHAMPNIARAEFRVLDAGGGAGPWVAQTSPVLLWRVAPLDRAIEVRGVNLRGLPGPSTRVALVAP